ncbi:S-layer homology domain-containing protein [Paenibacillus sinopodophylli]|uniref:S-layer homology domain-containing protein n=1 Tax=Paenibacillus sinopodophylli TaxID=1837342 RepID=UPI00110CBDB9|nr:S-layer homology domain-containing protein [Paenibacillus sinopodophylli]
MMQAMKMMKNKLLTLTLVLAVLVATFPSYVIYAEDDSGVNTPIVHSTTEYLWLEGENAQAYDGGYQVVGEGASSGASYLKLYTDDTDTVATAGYQLDIPATAKYDIWVLGTPGDNIWLSAYNWKLDTGAYSAVGSSYGESVFTTPDGMPFYWTKLSSTDLEQGQHDLGFQTNAPRQGNSDGLYSQGIDAVVAVPHAWQWIPNGLEQPANMVLPEADSLWIEGEDTHSFNGGYAVAGESASSGASYLKLYTSEANTVATADYQLDITATASYDVWVLGTPGDNIWLSGYKWKLDAGAYSAAGEAFGESVYGTPEGMPFYWIKLSSLYLEQGQHDLAFLTDAPRQGTPDGLYSQGIDAVVVVPQVWEWTPNGLEPPAPKPIIPPKYVWMEGEAASITGEYRSKYNAKASDKQILEMYTMTPGATGTADYEFDIPEAGSYSIWVLASPGDNPWLSPFKWKLDDASYKVVDSPSANTVYVTPAGLPMSWQKLGTSELSQGQHSLGFLTDTPRQASLDGLYSQAIDAWVIVPDSWGWSPKGLNKPFNGQEVKFSYVGGELDKTIVQREDILTVTTTNKVEADFNGELYFFADLMLNEEVVSREVVPSVKKSWTNGEENVQTMQLKIPFNAPDGSYEVRTGIVDIPYTNAPDGNDSVLVQSFAMGSAQGDAPELKAEIQELIVPQQMNREATLQGTASFELLQAIDFDTTAYLSFWKDDVLWGVSELASVNTSSLSVGENKEVVFDFQIPKDIPAASYVVKFGLHKLQALPSTPSLTVVSTTASSDGYKPLTNGSFVDKKLGETHFWYADQNHTMIWDGVPFVPIGGLFTSDYLIYFSTTDAAANKARWEDDKRVLQYMKAQGLKDLYINAVVHGAGIPAWAWQWLLDYLDEEGFTYGIQFNAINHGDEEEVVQTAYMPRASDGAASLKAASGGQFLKMYTKIPGSKGTADYSFHLPAAGNYDIWVLGTPNNQSYASTYQWKLDNGAYQSTGDAYGEPVFSTIEALQFGWHKLDSVELASGTHSLGFLTDTPRQSVNDGLYAQGLDAIAVVPEDWAWTPSGIAKPNHPINDYAWIEAESGNVKGAYLSGWLKVEDITQSGEVSLIVPSANVQNAVAPASSFSITAISNLFTVVNPKTGEVVASGKGTVEKQSGSMLEFKADVTVPTLSEGTYTVYFTPQVKYKSHVLVNIWDKGDLFLDKIKSHVSKLRLGPNFRLFVDPVNNESGVYAENESMLIDSPVYRAQFITWLNNRYSTIEDLNEAWKMLTPLPSFETAARLVPIVRGEREDAWKNQLLLVDSASPDATYKADAYQGRLWDDYADFRDDSFNDYQMEVADAINEIVSIPVIYKYVSSQRKYFINHQQAGGFQGIGGEVYGNSEYLVRERAGYPYSAAEQSAQTMWLITTETQLDENMEQKYNSGVKGYPDQQTMYNHFDNLIKSGSKGIYDFLLNCSYHTACTEAYAYYTAKPIQFEWLDEYRTNLLAPDSLAELVDYRPEVYYAYPAGEMWWGPNRRNVVLPGNDYQGGATLTTANDKWVLPTFDPKVKTDVLLVNLEDDPATTVYGKALLELGSLKDGTRDTVYMGYRRNLGALPEIDSYFTNEFTTLENGTVVQVLNPQASATAEIVYQTAEGKVWALRDGNLWIIGDTNWIQSFEGKEPKGTAKYIDQLDFAAVNGTPPTPSPSPTTPTPTPTPTSNNGNKTSRFVVDEGKVIVEFGSNETIFSVPMEKVGNLPVQVKSGAAVFTISPAVLSRLSEQAGAASGAILEVQMLPVVDSNISNSPVLGGKARVVVAGRIYELSITLTKLDGTVYTAEQVSGDVEISLPFTTGLDQDLLGIYFYNESTKQWEYVGGTVDKVTDTIKVQLKHLSKYAVLEYKKTFEDVPAAHWAARTLQVLAAKHLVTGVTETIFKPATLTTRAEFTALLVRALDLEPSDIATGFKDVKADSWYAKSLQAAVAAGIVTGISEDSFGPNQPITRAEIAVLMGRALKLTGNTASGDLFSDTQEIPSWAVSYVRELKLAGLVQGRTNNRFEPQEKATRAEAATFIFAIIKDKN